MLTGRYVLYTFFCFIGQQDVSEEQFVSYIEH